MVKRILHLDLETFSEVDLRKVGLHVYAAHPSTELLCFAWVFDDGVVDVWTPGQPLPDDVVRHIKDGGEVRAHNAEFERVVLNGVAGLDVGFPVLKIEQMVCTAAKVRAHGLPGALGACAKALESHEKDEAGRLTMLQLSKPRKGAVTRWTPANAPDKFMKLYKYCIEDVFAEREIDKLVPDLPESEQEIWQLDQEINQRGVGVDLYRVQIAQELVDEYKEEIGDKIRKITGFSPTQYAELTDWIRYNGYPGLPDMRIDTIEQCLEDDKCPDKIKEVLRLCSIHNMKAISKLKAMLAAAGDDQRIRGMFMYYGAGPGRWSSSIVQLQNIARPKIKDVDTAIRAAGYRDLELLKFLWDEIDPISVIASTVRSMLVGKDGNVIQSLDFAGIESRFTAWMFGEKWKLKAFADSDADDTCPDTYCVAYGSMFGVDPRKVDKDQRQIGKVVELAFGYEGGVGACVTAARAYKLDLEVLAEQALAALPPEALESAEWMWANYELPKGNPTKLPKDIYLACDGLKQAWRSQHAYIRAGWKDLLECAKSAVANTGHTYFIDSGLIRFQVEGDFLYMTLPSKRRIAYYKPVLERDKTSGKTVLTYMGMDTRTRQWKRTATYGGRLTENAAQGGSSDLLRHGMLNLHKEGYPLIMTVHDEVCAEIDPDYQSLERAKGLFTAKPPWAAGLPLAAEGYRAVRYKK